MRTHTLPLAACGKIHMCARVDIVPDTLRDLHWGGLWTHWQSGGALLLDPD